MMTVLDEMIGLGLLGSTKARCLDAWTYLWMVVDWIDWFGQWRC